MDAQISIRPYFGFSQSKLINDNELPSRTLIYDEQLDYTKLTYGLNVSKLIAQKIALGIDISYKQGGSDLVYNFNNHNRFIKCVALEYLDMMIDGQFQVLKKVGLSIGMYQALLLNSKWEYAGAFVREEEIVNKKEAYKRFDRGIELGINTRYKNIVLALQYQHGLTKIFLDDQLRWLSLNLGYELVINKK